MGASGCDFSNGTKIGNATITPAAFTFTLDQVYAHGSYTFDFNFYAGKCLGSDGGEILQADICVADFISQHAHDPSSYPLTSGSVGASTYTFDSTSTPRESWGVTYETFPIGDANRQYLTGEVTICAANFPSRHS